MHIYFFLLVCGPAMLWPDWEFINLPKLSKMEVSSSLELIFNTYLFTWHCVWPGLGRKRTIWKSLVLMGVGRGKLALPNFICFFITDHSRLREAACLTCHFSRPALCECLWLISKAVSIYQAPVTIKTSYSYLQLEYRKWIYLHYNLSTDNHPFISLWHFHLWWASDYISVDL